MDLRTEKTRRSIINSFMSLRSHKPLEKITVKELAENAEINKSTFYLHYHDIYDLSETLEREAVRSILAVIPKPEEIFNESSAFARKLGEACMTNDDVISVLFEGNRSGNFVSMFEKELMDKIGASCPENILTLESRMRVTYTIYGGYYTYSNYRRYGFENIIDIIENFSDLIIKNKD